MFTFYLSSPVGCQRLQLVADQRATSCECVKPRSDFTSEISLVRLASSQQEPRSQPRSEGERPKAFLRCHGGEMAVGRLRAGNDSCWCGDFYQAWALFYIKRRARTPGGRHCSALTRLPLNGALNGGSPRGAEAKLMWRSNKSDWSASVRLNCESIKSTSTFWAPFSDLCLLALLHKRRRF